MSQHSHKTEEFLLQQQRQRIRDQVLERFARYGHEPCQLILEYALARNGLQALLQTLGMQPSRSFDQQLENLARYLSENGASRFLSLVRAKKAAGLLDLEPMREAPKKPTGPVMPPPGDVTPPEFFDENGNYIGVERRLGIERRSGKDRRDRIDAIRKNKRWGPDRRKTIRRLADRTKQGKA